VFGPTSNRSAALALIAFLRAHLSPDETGEVGDGFVLGGWQRSRYLLNDGRTWEACWESVDQAVPKVAYLCELTADEQLMAHWLRTVRPAPPPDWHQHDDGVSVLFGQSEPFSDLLFSTVGGAALIGAVLGVIDIIEGQTKLIVSTLILFGVAFMLLGLVWMGWRTWKKEVRMDEDGITVQTRSRLGRPGTACRYSWKEMQRVAILLTNLGGTMSWGVYLFFDQAPYLQIVLLSGIERSPQVLWVAARIRERLSRSGQARAPMTPSG